MAGTINRYAAILKFFKWLCRYSFQLLPGAQFRPLHQEDRLSRFSRLQLFDDQIFRVVL